MQPVIQHCVYVCPYDHSGLSAAPTEYECRACARRFPIIDGIPIFIHHTLHPESAEHQRERDGWISAQDRDYGSAIRNAIEIPFILKNLDARPRDLVLDLACGKGRIAIPLLQSAPVRLVGIDFSFQALKGFRRRANESGVPAQIALADVTQLPFKPASFDRVVMSMLLLNIGSDDIVHSILRSVSSSMNADSKLLLTTFNYSRVVREVLRYPKKGYFPGSRVVCRHETPAELNDLLSGYFLVEKIAYLVSAVPKISGAFEHMGRLGVKFAAAFDQCFRNLPGASDRARVLAAICRARR
jgi:SAM-dependent methyltransferase